MLLTTTTMARIRKMDPKTAATEPFLLSMSQGIEPHLALEVRALQIMECYRAREILVTHFGKARALERS